MPPAAVVLGDLNMLRCFAGTDVPVVVAATDPHDVTLASRHARQSTIIAPVTEPERALDELAALSAQFAERPVLFYGSDAQLLFISRNRARLALAYRFRMPSAELVETFVDKHRFGAFAIERELHVPPQIGGRGASPGAVMATVGLPCVLKPNCHIGWFEHAALRVNGPRKAIVCTTEDELRAAWDEVASLVPDFIVQRYVPGGEDNVFSFHAYIRESGEIVRWFVGKKVRTYPRSAGVSTYLELAHAPDVERLGKLLCERAGVVGPVKLDIKRHADTGELFLLEINARFNLWHRLGCAAGINLPLVAYDDLADSPPHEVGTAYATDVRWLAFGDDLRSFLRSYHPGGLGWGNWLRSLRGKKVFDVFAWDDPRPMFYNAANYVRSLAQRVTG